VYGVVPPEAARICEKEVPAGALVRGVVVVMVRGATARNAIDLVMVLDTESVTVKLTEPVTAAVGIPDRVPLPGSRVTPAGSVPAVLVQV
jgi:hypothetical protein